MDEFWIRNNISFLTRYWATASEALRAVAAEPARATEFRDRDDLPGYAGAVIEGHLEHHHYSGVLLAYSTFDEFMIVLTERLGINHKAPITPNDLRDRGVRRYRKFVHQVCGIDADRVVIDWGFLEDFAVVRNAIIHANGNRSHLSNAKQLEQVVERRSPALGFKHEVKLVVTEEYVRQCLVTVLRAAMSLNAATG
jgi:hypothetical protein